MSIYTPGFDGDVITATNVNFSKTPKPGGQVTASGELLIGTGALSPLPEIDVGTITSPSGTITIGYVAPNITIDLAGGSVGIDSIAVQAVTAPGVSPVLPTGAGLVTFNGAAVAAQTIPVQSRSVALNSYQLEVQRASSSAATNATQQGISSYNSAQFSVDANGWVSIIPGAGSINITPNTGVNVTNSTFSLLGTSVAASGNPLRSNGTAANSIQLEIQRADDFGVSSAANAGIASFSNAQFSVDANGFVTMLNGLPASSFGVDAFTAPGTNPVLPTAGGLVTFTGAQVAAGTVPTAIRTDSLAANTVRIEVQRSSAQAVSSVAQNGVCHFNSAQFTVDANGFVSSIAGTAPWLDSAGGALVNHTGYFATAAAAYTLPAGVANGDQVEIVDTVGGGVVVTAQGGNVIQIQNVASSANGTATSTLKGDSLRLTFRLADGIWYATPGAGGNWLLA